MEKLSGKLLVASPEHLQSKSELHRAVIYLFQDSPEGTVGVMLNQPATESVREVWQSIVKGREVPNSRLSIGGPLSGPVLAIHGIEDLGDLRFSNNIFAAATRDNLKRLIEQQSDPYRVFFGLTGWKDGELEREMDAGLWLTSEPKSEYILESHDDLWNDLLRDKSNRFLEQIIRTPHIPTTSLEN